MYKKIRKKNIILDISQNECEWYTPDDPNLETFST